jgi:hypothetical protein
LTPQPAYPLLANKKFASIFRFFFAKRVILFVPQSKQRKITMLMSAKHFLWVVCVGFALFLTTPTAEAKGILIINTGEDVFETGSLPASIAADLPGAKAGYRCSVFGVFWAYIVTWGCTPVAYVDNGGTFSYNDEADVVKAVSDQYPPNAIKMGFWAHHGRWLMLAAILAFFGFARFFKNKNDQAVANEVGDADKPADQ